MSEEVPEVQVPKEEEKPVVTEEPKTEVASKVEETPKVEENPKVEEEAPKVEEEKKPEGEEEINMDEEDKKELYDAIKDLKPEEASDNIKAKLLSLAKVHLGYKDIETKKYGNEYDILEDKYQKQYKEIYKKIDDIVNSTNAIEGITDEDKTTYGITDTEEAPKAIDDYWLKVITNSRYFTINDKDKQILKYIKKVTLEKLENHLNNFRVDFIFSENEFFTPEVLSKTYEFDKEGVLKKGNSTKITWKSADKNPTIEKTRKKKKKGKKTVYEEKEEKVDSFFSFFNGENDISFLNDEVTFFKEDLFVNQLEYYLDIVSKTKAFAGDDDEEDDEDIEDQNDNKHGHEHGGDNNGQKQEECKQQ